MQPDQLVAELLARGDINDDTTVELNRILSDWREGRLDPDDESYLVALHARIIHGPQPTDEDAPSVHTSPRLEGLTIEEWRDRALRAEEALAALEDSARNG
jgi:hypothetical protein